MFLPRESAKCRTISSPKPKRSSNSRTSTEPPSEVTREPRKSTFKRAIERELKGPFLRLSLSKIFTKLVVDLDNGNPG